MHARTPKVAVHEDARKCTKVHKSAQRCTQDSAPYLDGPDTPNSTKLILFMLFGTHLTNIYREMTRKKQKKSYFFKPEKCSGKCSLSPGGAHIFCWENKHLVVTKHLRCRPILDLRSDPVASGRSGWIRSDPVGSDRAYLGRETFARPTLIDVLMTISKHRIEPSLVECTAAMNTKKRDFHVQALPKQKCQTGTDSSTHSGSCWDIDKYLSYSGRSTMGKIQGLAASGQKVQLKFS